MRDAKRWNPYIRKYTDIQVPDGCRACAASMTDPVVCPQCGETLPYGNTYTSLEIYNKSGLWGYAVCAACYEDERIRAIEAEKEALAYEG